MGRQEGAAESEVAVGQLLNDIARRVHKEARNDIQSDLINYLSNQYKVVERSLLESECEPRDNPVYKKALHNLISCYLKIDDAPGSAETHLMTAISLLAGETAWRPDNPEYLDVIEYANGMMALLHQN